MRGISFFVGLVLVQTVSESSNAESFVDDSKPIVAIENSHKQADAWATCAAVYDLASELLSESNPAQSKLLANMANGATLAVTMSILNDGLKPDITPERFTILWEMAKVAGNERPQIMRTALESALEGSSDEDQAAHLDNITTTMEVCRKKAPGQQAYIEAWREMAVSGAFQMPSK